MTEQVTRPQRTVLATVKSKAQAEDGWKVELDIPEFGSKFPTLCTRVQPAVAALVQPGQMASLMLEQQSLKKGRDGSFPSHYYWGLVGVASAGSLPQATTPKDPMVGGPPKNGLHAEWRRSNEDSPEKRSSIEAQSALQGAIALIAAKMRANQLSPNSLHVELIELTCWGMEAIQRAKVLGKPTMGAAAPPTVPPTTSPKTPATSDTIVPVPSEGQGAAAPSIPEYPHAGAFYEMVYRGWNRKVRSQVEAAFAEHKVEFPASWREAALYLIEWWGPPKP